MRATQNSTYRTILNQLNSINGRLGSLQTQAATGKKLNRPSDDPASIRPVLFTRAEITGTERYTRTIDSGLDRVNIMDGQFDHMQNILVRVKEIAIAANNGTLDAQNRKTFANEVAQLQEELLAAGNAQVDGKYVFSGYEIHNESFSLNPAYDPVTDPRPVLYGGDTGEFKVQIGPVEQVKINVTGNVLLLGDADNDGVTDPGAVDVFGVLKSLEEALNNNDQMAVAGTIGDIDAAREQISSERSRLGNTGRRLEDAKERMLDAQVELESILSRYEDADLVETISNLTQQESALEAALSVTGRLSQLSILDFV